VDFFSKQSEMMNTWLKQARRSRRLSDFDILLVQHMDYYVNGITQAIDGLINNDYTQFRTTALMHRHICHNALKEETLLFSNENCFITQFTQACMDVQLVDLAAVIRRHMQRAGSDAVPINTLLACYQPLNAAERAVLYALLLFPWAFIKISAQYYSKKRPFTPNAIMNRVQSILAQKEFHTTYIHELLNY